MCLWLANCPFLFQMWACALGHMDAAIVLYKWDRRAISIPDSLGRLPLAIARSRGHVKLAECLEQLQRDEQVQLGQNPRIHCPSSGESNPESWVAQWHSEIITSQEPQKGVTVMSSSNTGKNKQNKKKPDSRFLFANTRHVGYVYHCSGDR